MEKPKLVYPGRGCNDLEIDLQKSFPLEKGLKKAGFKDVKVNKESGTISLS